MISEEVKQLLVAKGYTILKNVLSSQECGRYI
jgi:hypothetical protein